MPRFTWVNSRPRTFWTVNAGEHSVPFIAFLLTHSVCVEEIRNSNMKLLPMRIQTCLLGMTLGLSWKRISEKWPLKPRAEYHRLVRRISHAGLGTVVCIVVLLCVTPLRFQKPCFRLIESKGVAVCVWSLSSRQPRPVDTMRVTPFDSLVLNLFTLPIIRIVSYANPFRAKAISRPEQLAEKVWQVDQPTRLMSFIL